ncbi:MAG: outer membrane beta-barrel protein [Chitinophagaceae bacterium]
MKSKFLPVIILLMSSAAANAQIKKGDKLLGASLSAGTSSYSGGSSSNAGISPRIGFGIANNWVLGARLGVSFYTAKSKGSDGKATTTSLSTTVFARKYAPIKNKIGWYAEPGVGYSRSKYKITQGSPISTQESWSVGAGITPGLYYQATDKILVSADFGGLNYSYQKSKGTGSNTYDQHNSTLTLTLLNSFSFGVDFIL